MGQIIGVPFFIALFLDDLIQMEFYRRSYRMVSGPPISTLAAGKVPGGSLISTLYPPVVEVVTSSPNSTFFPFRKKCSPTSLTALPWTLATVPETIRISEGPDGFGVSAAGTEADKPIMKTKHQ